MTAEVLPIQPGGPRLEVISHLAPSIPPEFDPKYSWSFPFRTQAQVDGILRFNLFCQSQKNIEVANSACRMFLRMWQVAQTWKIDNPLAFGRVVDVFLCDGGKSGGEQGIFTGKSGKQSNCIYIYDIGSFTEPVEMAREIAHEYGHAVLPAIKGFQEPEEWANGYLGEKLFLIELTKNPNLTKDDFMGADSTLIGNWIKMNATNLTDSIWLRGVDEKLLTASGQKAMNEYLGLNLFFHEALPIAFARGFKMNAGQTAKNSLDALLFALEERQSWNVEIPKRLNGRKLWLPFAKRWSLSGGTVIANKSNWVQVQPKSSTLEFKKK